MGRNHAHAKLAAICDALMQDENYTGKVDELVIKPLQKIMDERRRVSAQKTAATKVDFFTLVRGEND
jgi:alpha-D-ribose 1-methylphosphonate 5-triphosphate synthase subunit PhnG